MSSERLQLYKTAKPIFKDDEVPKGRGYSLVVVLRKAFGLHPFNVERPVVVERRDLFGLRWTTRESREDLMCLARIS